MKTEEIENIAAQITRDSEVMPNEDYWHEWIDDHCIECDLKVISHLKEEDDFIRDYSYSVEIKDIRMFDSEESEIKLTRYQKEFIRTILYHCLYVQDTHEYNLCWN